MTSEEKAIEAHFDKMQEYMKTAIKLKEIMLKRGLPAAKAECPHCKKGTILGRLVGPRKHIHAYCSTKNCLNVTE